MAWLHDLPTNLLALSVLGCCVGISVSEADHAVSIEALALHLALLVGTVVHYANPHDGLMRSRVVLAISYLTSGYWMGTYASIFSVTIGVMVPLKSLTHILNSTLTLGPIR